MNAKRYAPILLVALPGGTIAVVAFYAWRTWRRRAAVRELIGELRAGLPEIGRLYVDELAAAAVATAPAELGPGRWAFFFAGVISRESGFGLYLQPRGANGLGDGGHGHGLGQVDDRWNDDEPVISALRMEHLSSGDWARPAEHLLFCAELLRRLWDQLEQLGDPDERLQATAAAYNAGAPRVLAELAAGRSPDGVTTHADYGADVLTRAGRFAIAASTSGSEILA